MFMTKRTIFWIFCDEMTAGWQTDSESDDIDTNGIPKIDIYSYHFEFHFDTAKRNVNKKGGRLSFILLALPKQGKTHRPRNLLLSVHELSGKTIGKNSKLHPMIYLTLAESKIVRSQNKKKKFLHGYQRHLSVTSNKTPLSLNTDSFRCGVSCEGDYIFSTCINPWKSS